MKRPIIAVIGDGRCDKAVADLAEEVGRRVAEKGAVLLCGGYGGVMEAAARGAKKAGGTTLAVLSGKDREGMNPWIDIPIVTGMRNARNVAIALSADGLVAVAGGYGTLSEIAFALNAKKPLVGIRSWKLHRNGSETPPFPDFPTPQAAIEHLFQQL